MDERFVYEIHYRIDSSEYLETDSNTIKAYSVEELFDVILSIERKNTIFKIENVSLF